MKILVLLLIIFSAQAFSSDFMTEREQITYVENIAKDFRKSFWRAGHINVESRVNLLDLDMIQKYTESERNNRYEQPLDRDQISDIFSCFHTEACKVYRIHLNSEYWGGYGEEAKFVLLNVSTKNHYGFEHTVYNE